MQNINNIIVSGLGIGFIGKYSKLISSILAFIIAIIIKQLEYAEIILSLLIIASIMVGNYSLKKCLLNEEETPDWVIIHDVVGILISLNFFTENLLLNLFAFITFHIFNIFSPLMDKISLNLKYINPNMFKGIFIGTMTNSFVYLFLAVAYFIKS